MAPIGAGHFTNDLAMVLRTPFGEAERIKTKHGCCLASMVTDEEGIAVPTVAGGASRVVPKRELCEILQPRAEELFNMVRDDMKKHMSDESLRGGVVLTGGGAELDGLLEMAEQIFDAGVRYGLPRGLGGLVDVISSPTLVYRLGPAALRHGRRGEPAKVRKKSGFSVRGVVGSLRGMFSDLLVTQRNGTHGRGMHMILFDDQDARGPGDAGSSDADLSPPGSRSSASAAAVATRSTG